MINIALENKLWLQHKVGDHYIMDGKKSELWKISYYPILECGKTNELYTEARALIEKPIIDKFGRKIGIDFREVPLRYLTKIIN